ncbi:Uncharacterized conserved protein [Phaffia rhodozyma]|uniref:Uncharacterized conserved protein n=1 Tax=Phaffia rhodozyma TaxID=264483 RepID=A0A0F7SXA9_PHARH|nr:Uncharacterized conserved protein [Phaffia rhodozyma]
MESGSLSSFDLDDDGWEDMPIIRSEPNALGLDDEDQKKYHYRAPAIKDDSAAIITGNAAGATLEYDDLTVPEGQSWRGKIDQDEKDYTRLRLEEDHEADAVHMRTQYLFDEEQAMTPLSQMKATKNLLSEGQRIAYVGLCKLACEEMVKALREITEAGYTKKKLAEIAKGKGKEVKDEESTEACKVWALKIMARLYHHMELQRDEQKMIESLAAHGVEAMDLVPSLMTTHSIPNPEYDPNQADERRRQQEQDAAASDIEDTDESSTPRKPSLDSSLPNSLDPTDEEGFPPEKVPLPVPKSSDILNTPHVPQSRASFQRSTNNPFESEGDLTSGFEDDDVDVPVDHQAPTSKPTEDSSLPPPPYSKREKPPDQTDGLPDEGGDIGSYEDEVEGGSMSKEHRRPSSSSTEDEKKEKVDETEEAEKADKKKIVGTTTALDKPEEDVTPVLPGVTTTLSAADETVVLDIRWTILCDLFLCLIADSVYDARSRVLLERVASKLQLSILDVVRFEKRITDSLEIQEGVERLEQHDVIESRKKDGRNKRYVAIGLATLGGGLVIGLSAGLLAPVIGAALGGALTTVGITGTSSFLAGAGGAAVITTGGVLSGGRIASKGMARRTQVVRVFELRALHNQKRVNCWITVPGFMDSKDDDVRLPFSTIDPMIGDVFSTFWEPEMMEEMGNALKILTTEVLTTVGQTVLQATVMTALLSALQWPLILTKLAYLIDNPWSNALDRSKAAGLVLADALLQRHVGVRPVSLIGFSLGARAIFYALVELARVKAFGIVQDVYLFGTTITANKKTWLGVRSVVAGRLVNGYARNDWILGYLFRATAAGNTVAGLRPVEGIPGLENFDVTDKIAGHLSYRPMMPLLLHSVGLPVTADYFDEPEEPEFLEDRIVVNEAEEEAKKAAKKSWFSRKKNKPSTPITSRGNSSDLRRTVSSSGGPVPAYDEEDTDLPSREENQLPSMIPSASSTQPLNLESDNASSTSLSSSQPPQLASGALSPSVADSDEFQSHLPPRAGFDFQAISKALGKDIDIENLPSSGTSSAQPTLPSLNSPLTLRQPLERSESTSAFRSTPLTLASSTLSVSMDNLSMQPSSPSMSTDERFTGWTPTEVRPDRLADPWSSSSPLPSSSSTTSAAAAVVGNPFVDDIPIKGLSPEQTEEARDVGWGGSREESLGSKSVLENPWN